MSNRSRARPWRRTAQVVVDGTPLAVPARFQPQTQDAQILEDADWPKTTYHVYLGTDIFAPNIPVEPATPITAWWTRPGGITAS